MEIREKGGGGERWQRLQSSKTEDSGAWMAAKPAHPEASLESGAGTREQQWYPTQAGQQGSGDDVSQLRRDREIYSPLTEDRQ